MSRGYFLAYVRPSSHFDQKIGHLPRILTFSVDILYIRYLVIMSAWTGLVTYIMCLWYIISVLSLRPKIPSDNWDFRCITKKSFLLSGIWRQTPARCVGRTWVFTWEVGFTWKVGFTCKTGSQHWTAFWQTGLNLFSQGEKDKKPWVYEKAQDQNNTFQ